MGVVELELGLEEDEELDDVKELVVLFDCCLLSLQMVGLLLPFFPVYFEKTDELILYQRECRFPLDFLA